VSKGNGGGKTHCTPERRIDGNRQQSHDNGQTLEPWGKITYLSLGPSVKRIWGGKVKSVENDRRPTRKHAGILRGGTPKTVPHNVSRKNRQTEKTPGRTGEKFNDMGGGV